MATVATFQWRYTGLAANMAVVSRPADAVTIWNANAGVLADEAYNASNIADYRTAPTEQGATGNYSVTHPATTAGWRRLTWYRMASTTLVVADLLEPLYEEKGYWTGSAWIVGAADLWQWRASLPAVLADTDKVPASVQHMATNSVSGAAFSTDAADVVADHVWDESSLAHTALNSFGALMAAIKSGIDALGVVFTGITSMAQWLGLIAGKQAGNSTARTELRATGAGSGTFDETTDSQEALRDRGDAAWVTATGFSTLDAAGVRTAVGLSSANLDTQLDALPTNSELATALTTALTATVADSVPADGTRPSIASGVYMITQMLTEFAISGTTLTVKKPDGTTALMTFTLNDSANPTALTRAT